MTSPSQLRPSNLKLSTNHQKKFQLKLLHAEQQQIKAQNTYAMSREQAILSIIDYSKNKNNLIDQYSEDFFISYFDRDQIQRLTDLIQSNQVLKKGQFVKTLATFINHNQNQTLFLIIRLIDIFEKILNQTKNQQGVSISDFTSYICDKISNTENYGVIPLKEIPADKTKPNSLKIRSIDLQPPIIFQDIVEKSIPQISNLKKKKDKKIDQQKPLSQFFISPSTRFIMTLGSLSSVITIYSMNFQKKKQIVPSCFKILQKKLAILSFAFSQKQQRIGAIINNIGIAFWDFSDQFRTQKLIQTTNAENKIYFLELSNQWITSGQNKITFWDLKNQSIKTQIKEQNSKIINHICEITHIRAISVAYTMKNDQKQIIIYQPQRKPKNYYDITEYHNKKQTSQIQFKKLARINLSPCGCHTLYYNRFTQIIVPLIYHKSIPLYGIESKSLDISLIQELKGHETVVTSITQIDQSDVIITGDDQGYIIIWTLSNTRRQQMVRIANQIKSLYCIGSVLYFGDSRINMIELEGINMKTTNKKTNTLLKNQLFYGIFKSYHPQKNQLCIFTCKTCRILSMLNGKTQKVIKLCSEDEQITSAQNYFNGYIIGTSKGDIICYSSDFQLKWKIPSAHQSDITELITDQVNKCFLSNSGDSNIFVWANKTLLEEGPRKSLMNGQDQIKEEIIFTQLSQKFGVFITCSYSNQVRIWDYQSFKLVHIIEISGQKSVYPISLKICKHKPLVFTACSNEVLLAYKFDRKDNSLSFKLILKIFNDIFIQSEIDNQKINNKNSQELSIPNSCTRNQERSQQDIKYPQSSFNTGSLSFVPNPNSNIIEPKTKQQKLVESHPKKPFLIQKILVESQQKTTRLIIAYSKGSILYLNLNEIIQQYYQQYNEQKFKKSVNIQRPIKQSLIKQIYKSQIYKSTFDQNLFNLAQTITFQNVIWNQKLHKDALTHIDIFQLEFISTLCLDGYYKLITLTTGSTLCSLNINFPLPIKWDYKPQKAQGFCQKVHEALVLLDQIFNNADVLTQKQFNALNIKPFLDMICRPHQRRLKLKEVNLALKHCQKFTKKENILLKQQQLISNNFPTMKRRRGAKNRSIRFSNQSKMPRVEILSDQFTPQDLKQGQQFVQSLKSFEVYKRVRKFINIRDFVFQQLGQVQPSKSSRTQQIMELLSPDYFSKLQGKDINIKNSSKQDQIQQKKSRNSVKNDVITSMKITLTKDDFQKLRQPYYQNLSHSKSKNNPTFKQQNFQLPYENKHEHKSSKRFSKIEFINELVKKNLLSNQKMHFKKRPSKIFSSFKTKKAKSITRLSSTIGRFQMNSKKCIDNYSNHISSSQESGNLTSSAFQFNQSNLVKELCSKTHELKRIHKIIKL